MAEYDELVRVLAVKQRGIASLGDIGFIDIDDAGARIVRLGMPADGVPMLIAELEALAAMVAKARLDAGKPSHPTLAKGTESVQAMADHGMGAVILRLNHPNKTTTNVAVNAADVDVMISLLQQAKLELAQTQKGSPH